MLNVCVKIHSKACHGLVVYIPSRKTGHYWICIKLMNVPVPNTPIVSTQSSALHAGTAYTRDLSTPLGNPQCSCSHSTQPLHDHERMLSENKNTYDARPSWSKSHWMCIVKIRWNCIFGLILSNAESPNPTQRCKSFRELDNWSPSANPHQNQKGIPQISSSPSPLFLALNPPPVSLSHPLEHT